MAFVWLGLGPPSASASAPVVINTIPVGSGPVAVSSDGTHVWVANFYDDTVSEIDASTGTVVATIPVPPTYAPPVGVSSDGIHVWVTNQGPGNAMTELNASTGAVVKTIQVDRCSNFGDPYGVSSDGTRVWITVPDCGVVGEVDGSTGTLIGDPSVGNDPTGVSSDGVHVWVANQADDTVSEIDASTGTVVQTIAVGSEPDAVSSDKTDVWVANDGDNTVTEIDALTGTVVQTILVGSGPDAVSSDGTHVWVANYGDSTVSEIDASTGTVVGTISVGTGPDGVSSDGTHVWVANSGDNTVSEIQIPKLPGSPSISTSQQPASATVGSPIADQATVSGGDSPSGTVTFNLYDNPNATGPPLFTDTEPLSGATATSASYTTTAPGTDYWVATYNGDANNNPVSSGSADEPVTIGGACGGASSSMARFTAFAVGGSTAVCEMSLTDNSTYPGEVYAGGDLIFTADLTGSVGNGPPTGTVDFTITAPDGKPAACTPATPSAGGSTESYSCTLDAREPGHYEASAAYNPAPGSPYQPNSANDYNANVNPAQPGLQVGPAEKNTLWFADWCTSKSAPFLGELGLGLEHPLEALYCGWHWMVVMGDNAAAADPPDSSFRVVFEPKPFTVPKLGTCPRLRGASCRRLRTAEGQYLDALAKVASLSEAVGVTANRFGGAKDAGDYHAEWLQGVAETKYLPLQASAISALQRAGRRLGALLRRDHLNLTLTAKQVAQGQKRLGKLDGISRSLVARLERDGLITSRRDLKQIVAALLKKEPRARTTTLAQSFDT